MATATKAKKRPVFEALRRRNCQGALWANTDGDGRTFYTPTLTRSYKDENQQWRNDTLRIPLDDIQKAIAVLQDLERAAYEKMQADYEASREAA